MATTYYNRHSHYPRAATWSKKGKRFLRRIVDFSHGNLPVTRLTPDDIEARSEWWVSSKAYFDDVIDQAERGGRSSFQTRHTTRFGIWSTTPFMQPAILSYPGTYNWQNQIPSHMGNPKLQTPIETHPDAAGLLNQELAEYINTLSWNRPAFYNYDDDDEDYTITITPVLSIEEPIDSLIMEDEHLDTILATESDEVIKSSIEDLVPILSESEGIPDNMCDVPFRDNSPPLDMSKDQFEGFFDSNDDSTSIDDDYFFIDDIAYVEASPPNSELVSLEEVKDDILREKLLNIHLLIAKIESLNDNPTPDRVLKSPSLFPIPVEDSDSFFEKFDTSLSYSDNSLPGFETFSDHTKETSSGSTTTHTDNSLPKYDSFLF
nr:hypothetical protein [Tanacetum cinerariifolium]